MRSKFIIRAVSVILAGIIAISSVESTIFAEELIETQTLEYSYEDESITDELEVAENDNEDISEYESLDVEILDEIIEPEIELEIGEKIEIEASNASELSEYVAIHNREELSKINSFSGHKFYLANDIDLAGENWIPINNFIGTFDGQGHTIKNMTIDSDDYVHRDNGYMNCGLFSDINCDLGYESRICNLKLENVSIVASDTSSVGAVAGYVTTRDKGVIFDNITVSGRIEVDGRGAGIIGDIYNYETNGYGQADKKVIISNCTNNADVICTDRAAGIVQSVVCNDFGLEITDCTNNGNITDNSENSLVAGISASIDAYMATITGCSNAGSITGTHAAGLFGTLSEAASETKTYAISSCSNLGSITATRAAAGITYAGGNNYVGCSNSGALTLDGKLLGAIAGIVDNTDVSCSIEDCSNSGSITVTSPCDEMGGIVASLGNSYGYGTENSRVVLKNCLNTANLAGAAHYASGIACSVSGAEIEISGCDNDGRLDLEEILPPEYEYIYGYMESTAAGIVSFVHPGKGQKLVENNTNRGDICGTKSAGIICQIGYNYSEGFENTLVTGCENYGAIKNGAGIVYSGDRITVDSSNNYGSISGSNIAGIVANVDQATYVDVSRCKNYGNITDTRFEDEDFISVSKSAGISLIATKVEECINYGKVVSSGEASGIICGAGEVARCINNGDISGRSQTEGIVGEASTVSECINNGDVVTSFSASGEEENWDHRNNYVTAGIIAIGVPDYSWDEDISFTISNCYNTGDIRTEINNLALSGYRIVAGGIVGENQDFGSAALIENCYNIGNIYAGPNTSGRVLAAGIVGRSSEIQVNSCISVAPRIVAERDIEIWGDEENYSIAEAIGIGINENATKNLYRKDASCSDSSPRSVATEPLKFEEQTTYTDLGWDFTDVWKMPSNEHALPVLIWSGYEEGTDIDYSSDNRITLSEVVEYMDPGDTITITPKVKYNGVIVEKPEITWLSTNAEVATVENGVVTSHGLGEATIVARYKNIRAICSIYVSLPIVRAEGWHEKRLNLRFEANKGDVFIPVNWGWETLVKGDSYTYDENLAVIGLSLSCAVEVGKDKGISRMKDLGFKNVAAYNFDADNHISHPGVVIGSTSFVQDRKRMYMFGISVRGTSSGKDILTDIKSEGDGFLGAGESVIAALKKHVQDYYEMNDLRELDPDNTYMFVTGHSLGGASSQQVARMITPYTYKDHTYVYTFASPNINCQADAPENYKNVFNVVNVADKIPAVPIGPYFHEWGTYLLRKIGTTRSFNYKPEVVSEFNKYSDTDLRVYTTLNQYNPFSLFPDHSCSVYMAQITSDATYLSGSLRYKTYRIHCPVDVEVYDKNGNLLGRIADNTIDNEVPELIPMFIDGNHKEIIAPEDLELDIKITATDSGTMEYIVESYENGTDNATPEVRFENVQLDTGKTMLATIDGDDTEYKLFVTDDKGNRINEILEDGSEKEVIPDGFRIVGVEESYAYTGSAIKPEIQVYDEDTLLTIKKDYIIAYKNNVKSYELSKDDEGYSKAKAPTIIVTGKGNYSGKETVTFKICKKNIDDDDITVNDIAPAIEKTKPYKPVPVVKYGEKTLNSQTDYSVRYYDSELLNNEVVPKASGTYYAKITGRGQFTGDRFVSFYIAPGNKKLVSSLTVEKIKNVRYVGEEIDLDADQLVVKDVKETLTRGEDYDIEYLDNHTDIGTVRVRITSLNDKYVGSKIVSFRIIGTSIGKAQVNGLKSTYTYDGTEKKQDILSIKYDENVLTGIDKNEYLKKSSEEKRLYDYILEYQKNVDKGTAKVIIEGVNKYSGSISRTYKINPYNISNDLDNKVTVEFAGEMVSYAKSGAKPMPTVKFDGNELIMGKDYTLSWINNANVNDGSGSKVPTILVKGKGNFTGTEASCTFSISARNIADGSITLNVADKVWTNKKLAWKSTVTLNDVDGKRLTIGKDYSSDIMYTYENGQPVGNNDIVPAGTVIKVSATGINKYSGTIIGEYRVIKHDISKLNVTLEPKKYTGKPITICEEDLTFKAGKNVVNNVTFIIDETSYKNNINKGKATVLIRGTGEYGGRKVVNITIGAKGIIWWWNNLLNR